jgi:hypothetical protein
MFYFYFHFKGYASSRVRSGLPRTVRQDEADRRRSFTQVLETSQFYRSVVLLKFLRQVNFTGQTDLSFTQVLETSQFYRSVVSLKFLRQVNFTGQ